MCLGKQTFFFGLRIILLANISAPSQIQRWVDLFVMDPFVDLFITLCILANTAFMALEYHKMPDSLQELCDNMNYVSPKAEFDVLGKLLPDPQDPFDQNSDQFLKKN